MAKIENINLLGTTYDIYDDEALHTLPQASASTLGGVKVGNNLTINNNGVLSADVASSDITTLQNEDTNLQSQIDAIVASSDVKDIVGTYAALQQYDTSTLGDNDIIKVLQDETHNNETTYYRWSTSSSTFTLIGEEGPYYTKSATDTLLNNKADKSTTYTKTQTDNLLSAKADQSTTYTKTETDTALGNKLDSATTFWGQTANNGAVNGSLIFEGDPLTTGTDISLERDGSLTIHTGSGGWVTFKKENSALANEVEFNMAALVDIADGENDTDAINLRQLKRTLLVNGSTAPTTSTVGKVGSLCSYVQNGVKHIAVCTAVIPGNPPTYTWTDFEAGGLVTLSYGHSTWQDFIDAYNGNKIVYCKASSATDPASGSQTRLAFMAYVNNETNPTNVEFQYVRSVSSKTAAQQMDQVFVYKLTNANGGTWTVETRNMTSKVVAGTNMTSSYSNGTITLNADDQIQSDWNQTTTSAKDFIKNKPDIPVITMTTTDPGEGSPLAANNFIAVYSV